MNHTTLKIIAPIGMLAHIVKHKIIQLQKFDVQEINDANEGFLEAPDMNIDFTLICEARYVSYRYILCPEPYSFFDIHNNQIACVLVVKFVQWHGLTICCLSMQ
jgi:hypothetical protein